MRGEMAPGIYVIARLSRGWWLWCKDDIDCSTLRARMGDAACVRTVTLMKLSETKVQQYYALANRVLQRSKELSCLALEEHKMLCDLEDEADSGARRELQAILSRPSAAEKKLPKDAYV